MLARDSSNESAESRLAGPMPFPRRSGGLFVLSTHGTTSRMRRYARFRGLELERHQQPEQHNDKSVNHAGAPRPHPVYKAQKAASGRAGRMPAARAWRERQPR